MTRIRTDEEAPPLTPPRKEHRGEDRRWGHGLEQMFHVKHLFYSQGFWK